MSNGINKIVMYANFLDNDILKAWFYNGINWMFLEHMFINTRKVRDF